MRELALFAGIGAGMLGTSLLGHTTVCAVEIGKYQRRQLLARQLDRSFPKFPIWDDVKTFDGKPWRGCVDVVSGGFPCQDISSANPRGRGLDGERSGLWSEYARIIDEVAPTYVFAENSDQLRIKGLDRVLADLERLGYITAWGTMSAYDCGAEHLRRRMWLVARRLEVPDANASLQHAPARRRAHATRSSELRECLSFLGAPPLLQAIPLALRALSEPEFLRKDQRDAETLDRNAGIGNAQHPVVAANAFAILRSRVDALYAWLTTAPAE